MSSHVTRTLVCGFDESRSGKRRRVMIFHFPHWVVSFRLVSYGFCSFHFSRCRCCLFFWLFFLFFFLFFASVNFPPFTHFTSIWLDRLFRATRATQPGGGKPCRRDQQQHSATHPVLFSQLRLMNTNSQHTLSLGYVGVLGEKASWDKRRGIWEYFFIYLFI